MKKLYVIKINEGNQENQENDKVGLSDKIDEKIDVSDENKNIKYLSKDEFDKSNADAIIKSISEADTYKQMNNVESIKAESINQKNFSIPALNLKYDIDYLYIYKIMLSLLTSKKMFITEERRINDINGIRKSYEKIVSITKKESNINNSRELNYYNIETINEYEKFGNKTNVSYIRMLLNNNKLSKSEIAQILESRQKDSEIKLNLMNITKNLPISFFQDYLLNFDELFKRKDIEIDISNLSSTFEIIISDVSSNKLDFLNIKNNKRCVKYNNKEYILVSNSDEIAISNKNDKYMSLICISDEKMKQLNELVSSEKYDLRYKLNHNEYAIYDYAYSYDLNYNFYFADISADDYENFHKHFKIGNYNIATIKIDNKLSKSTKSSEYEKLRNVNIDKELILNDSLRFFRDDGLDIKVIYSVILSYISKEYLSALSFDYNDALKIIELISEAKPFNKDSSCTKLYDFINTIEKSSISDYLFKLYAQTIYNHVMIIYSRIKMESEKVFTDDNKDYRHYTEQNNKQKKEDLSKIKLMKLDYSKNSLLHINKNNNLKILSTYFILYNNDTALSVSEELSTIFNTLCSIKTVKHKILLKSNSEDKEKKEREMERYKLKDRELLDDRDLIVNQQEVIDDMYSEINDCIKNLIDINKNLYDYEDNM